MSLKNKILRLLGTNEVQVRWKVDRMKERLKKPDDEPPKRAKDDHKHCPQCRAWIDGAERRCPHCGARTPSLAFVKTTRFLRSLLPEDQPATKIILAVLFGFFGLMVLDGVQMVGSDQFLSVVITPPGEVMFRWGAHIRGDFDVWRIVMSNFIHFGVIHLGFNAYALRLAGPEVERYYGSALAFALFMATGFAAMAFSNVVGGVGIVAGASGALMGFIGLAGAAGHRAGTSYGMAVRALMIRWAAFVMIFGIAASFTGAMAIDNLAHFGGLAAGVGLGMVVPIQGSPGWSSAWRMRLAALGTAVALGAIGFGVYGMISSQFEQRAFQACVSKLQAGEYVAAIPLCEEARARNIDDPGAYHNLAQAYLRAQRGADAERVCADAAARFRPEQLAERANICHRLSIYHP